MRPDRRGAHTEPKAQGAAVQGLVPGEQLGVGLRPGDTQHSGCGDDQEEERQRRRLHPDSRGRQRKLNKD